MNSATFEITGTVKYQPKGIGLKVETISTNGFKVTHEVLCFKGEADGIKEGDTVTVTGELGAKKSEYVRKYNGKEYPVYITQLVALKVRAGGVVAAPGAPADDDMPF
jgi:hypothetical protein